MPTPSLKRVLTLLDSATLAEVNNGKVWYLNAHDNAKDLAKEFGTTLDTTSKLISILSPGCTWTKNLKDAKEMLLKRDKAIVSTYGSNKRKALSLLNGEEVSFRGGLKTFNFYNNILYPLDDSFVTIDRHAIKACSGMTRGGSVALNVSLYNKAKEVYIKASKETNLLPNQVQAICWLAYKRWRLTYDNSTDNSTYA